MKNFVLNKELPINVMLMNPETHMLDVATYNVCFSIVTNATGSSEKELRDAQKQQNISFTKVTMFIEHVLNNSVLVEKEWFDENVAHVSVIQNTVVVLPSITEDAFVASLHCKFNTIVSENTVIETVKLVDTQEKLSYNYMMIDEFDYHELPSTAEWCNEFSYWETPWWYRDDICTMDRNAENKEEFDTWKRNYAETDLDSANRMLFDQIEQEFDAAFSGEEIHNGELIEVDFKEKKTWRPTLV